MSFENEVEAFSQTNQLSIQIDASMQCDSTHDSTRTGCFTDAKAATDLPAILLCCRPHEKSSVHLPPTRISGT